MLGESENGHNKLSEAGASLGTWLDTTLQQMGTWAFWKPIVWAIISIIMSLVLGAFMMLLSGYNPLVAYSALLSGMLRQPDLTLFYTTPLILTGLSVALAFKCGLFNIGAEGQVYMGSIVAAIIGYAVALPIFVHPIVCLALGALAGAVWGAIPGFLKAYRGAHEVVTTMMLSYTAILFTSWLATYPLIEPNQLNPVNRTPPILPTAILPKFFGQLHLGIVVSLLAVVAVYFLINRTVLGYEMRAVGFNREAAETAGINARTKMVLALALSGALAGLAGSEEVLGTYHRFIDHWSSGLGFDGVTVAVLGRNHPVGCLLAALFFGGLRAGSTGMNAVAHVPPEMIGVIQGLVVIFVAAPQLNDWFARKSIKYAAWMKKHLGLKMWNLVALFFGVGSALLSLAYSMFGMLNVSLSVCFLFVAIANISSVFVYAFSRHHVFALHYALTTTWLAPAAVDLLFSGGALFAASILMFFAGTAIALSFVWATYTTPTGGGIQI